MFFFVLVVILLRLYYDIVKVDWLMWLMGMVIGGFFYCFNCFFDSVLNCYVSVVCWVVCGSVIVMVFYVGFVGLIWFGFY